MADVKVRAILTDPAELSGLFTTPSGVALKDGDLVLPTDQPSPLENDFRRARSGAWEKATDIALVKAMEVRVLEGDADETRGSSWVLRTGDQQPVRGDTALVWDQETKVPRSVPGAGTEDVQGVFGLKRKQDLAGEYRYISGELDDRGQFVSVFSSPPLVPPDSISGLGIRRADETGVAVASGSAWVPGAGAPVELQAEAVLRGPNAGGAWPAGVIRHVYLGRNVEGVPTVEALAEQPAAPYFGDAMARSTAAEPDATRRYLGSFLTAANGQLRQFNANGADHLYLFDVADAGRVVNGGVATAEQTVNLVNLGLVPRGTRRAWLRVATGGAGVVLGNSEDSIALGPGSTGVRTVRANQDKDVLMPLDANGAFSWCNASSGGSAVIEVLGYRVRR